MQGSVSDLQLRLRVRFRIPGSPDVEIEFVVDTGFLGDLTLPPQDVTALGLPYLEEIAANLADDSYVEVDVHVATIVWDGVGRKVTVLAMGKRPLLGTALLNGHRLSADVEEGGPVRIDELNSGIAQP